MVGLDDSTAPYVSQTSQLYRPTDTDRHPYWMNRRDHFTLGWRAQFSRGSRPTDEPRIQKGRSCKVHNESLGGKLLLWEPLLSEPP